MEHGASHSMLKSVQPVCTSIHVQQLLLQYCVQADHRSLVLPSKPRSMGTDLDSYEWLGHLGARRDWYLAPLAMYWEW